MDIAESRRPQDGRILFDLNDDRLTFEFQPTLLYMVKNLFSDFKYFRLYA